MGQVLYRKYRSKNLSEVIGQDHITAPLEHALKSGKLAHAYLLTGPRGVGKTSVARILAYEINGLPYSDDSNMDIIEIDAASNRRIDEIRDLRDKVNIAPTSLKYKVYIIDEVHMLTREAFNALLKTLEEPPAHVVFILATTEAHKLPDTIISRTQRYSFKPVSKQKVIDHLKSIAKKEKISINDDALDLIAEHGEGSFRDSISLLDQLRHQDKAISLDDVRLALGIAPLKAVNELIKDIAKSDIAAVDVALNALYEQGFQATILAKQLSSALRAELLKDKSQLDRRTIITLLKELLEIPTSSNPESLLEVTLIKISLPDESSIVVAPPVAEALNVTPSVAQTDAPESVMIIESTKSEPKTALKAGSEPFDIAIWPKVLKTIKKKHNTLYSFLRMAQPEFSDELITLHFAFKFHQQRISESKNMQSILDTIYELTGKNIKIVCIFTAGTLPYETAVSETEVPSPEIVSDPAMDNINNIFGSSEVLES
jgi:DNA polymerase-3 subunit gamma/tau